VGDLVRFSHGLSFLKSWVCGHFRLVLGLVVVSAAVAGGAGYFIQRSVSSQDHWARAQQALEDREFAVAQGHLAEYLRVNPTSAEGHFLLAQAARRALDEDFELADKHLQKAALLGWPEDDIELETILGAVQGGVDVKKSEKTLEPFLQTRQERKPLVLEALARGCIRAQDLSQAGGYLGLWIRDFPRDWYARLWRGSLFQLMGRPEDAVEDFRQAWKVRPHSTAIQKHLGLVLIESGWDPAEAVKHLERYRRTDPEDVVALVALARGYRAVGKLEKARALLLQARTAEPRQLLAILTLALVEMDLGHDRSALQLVEPLTWADLHFDYPAALEQMLHLQLWMSRPKISERQETVLYLKATLLERLGRKKEAESCRRQILQLREEVSSVQKAIHLLDDRPNDVALMYQLGVLNLRLDQTEDGKAWLLQVLKVQPDHWLAHQALAEYYESLHTPEARERAAHHRQRALEMRR
jgi:Tfp pilus assembly protein PilF